MISWKAQEQETLTL